MRLQVIRLNQCPPWQLLHEFETNYLQDGYDGDEAHVEGSQAPADPDCPVGVSVGSLVLPVVGQFRVADRGHDKNRQTYGGRDEGPHEHDDGSREWSESIHHLQIIHETSDAVKPGHCYQLEERYQQ